jgi:FAD/FMN-containing dehydrogenase
MNPTAVATVERPTSVESLANIVRSTKHPISIAGGRYSMGGQSAYPDSTNIDMRGLNKILLIDTENKEVTVQAGATWQEVQAAIDPHNLAVRIMQSYANFTVGGSLSVNVHGRYIGAGPIVSSVKVIQLVLPNGSLVRASRSEHPGLFAAAIGGYGGIGIITEATLYLADNSRVARSMEKIPVQDYGSYFSQKIRNDGAVVFQNADIIPSHYENAYSVVYRETTGPLTIPNRLMPRTQPQTGLESFLTFAVRDLPGGMGLRPWLEPLRYRSPQVTTRNYEASYDVASLAPIATLHESYVLQEYFIPVQHYQQFVGRLQDILTAYQVDIANISIRHARPDTETILSWAPEEVFAFVLYYRQRTNSTDRRLVGRWTRALVDAALELGGTYYLPYQPHASREQFLRAYPRAVDFFGFKDVVDPNYRLRSKLFSAYYQPDDDRKTEELSGFYPTYARPEEQSLLTLLEWYLVYASKDLAEISASGPVHRFPFFTSVWNIWTLYAQALKINIQRYPWNSGYHLMDLAIGLTTSIEYILKGAYEGTVGRLTAWIGAGGMEISPVEHFIGATYGEYAAFIEKTPWYKFPFASKLEELSTISRDLAESRIRYYDRKLSFQVELYAKSVLASLFDSGTNAIYSPEDSMVGMVVHNPDLEDVACNPESLISDSSPEFDQTDLIKSISAQRAFLRVPRYQQFTAILHKFFRKGRCNLVLDEVAGNREIAVSIVAPVAWDPPLGAVSVYRFSTADGEHVRTALLVPVRTIPELIRHEADQHITVEHVYDY